MLLRATDLHTILPYGNSNRTLSGARRDQKTNASNMDSAEGESAPKPCLPEGSLPFLTGDLIVRWLLLVGPD
jgi:hypothetical protein